MAVVAAAQLDENASPQESVLRNAAKRALVRVLPEGTYQRVLALSKARDFASGRLREDELDLVAAFLSPGDTAIDVGANHGMWTLSMSKAVGLQGHVYAFEPIPFTFGTLRAVVRRAGASNVTLSNKGCSDEAGLVDMAVPVQAAGASDDMQAHIASRTGETLRGPREDVIVRSEMAVLDDPLADAERVRLLKIDVEGAELLVLNGARKLIERHRPAVVCEVDAAFLDGFGSRPQDIASFFGSLGYAAHHYEATRGCLAALDSLDEVVHANVVFCHPESHPDPETILG